MNVVKGLLVALTLALTLSALSFAPVQNGCTCHATRENA